MPGITAMNTSLHGFCSVSAPGGKLSPIHLTITHSSGWEMEQNARKCIVTHCGKQDTR